MPGGLGQIEALGLARRIVAVEEADLDAVADLGADGEVDAAAVEGGAARVRSSRPDRSHVANSLVTVEPAPSPRPQPVGDYFRCACGVTRSAWSWWTAGADARVWAPGRRRVDVVPAPTPSARPRSTAEPDGYFSGVVRGLRAGDRYGFRLDDDAKIYPDPASRAQPDGPHGLSAVVDPTRFAWTDADWRGVGRAAR